MKINKRRQIVIAQIDVDNDKTYLLIEGGRENDYVELEEILFEAIDSGELIIRKNIYYDDNAIILDSTGRDLDEIIEFVEKELRYQVVEEVI